MTSDTTVDYKEFINVIKRGKVAILLITMLLTLAAISFSYYSMKSSKVSYETKTSVILGKKEDIAKSADTNTTYEDIASSSTIPKKVSTALKGAITAKDVESMYEITVSADAPILTITANGESQKEANDIAKAVSSSFAKEVVRIYPTESIKIMEDTVQSGIQNSTFKIINVILAFLLGLFLSVFIVTFIGFFDEKIRTKADVEKYLELEVIGKLPRRKRRDI
ncbi:MAG: YveK family protein [Clostridium sp.]|uniref:YveK family protein n=1 Tax=Clostridium sp. TaxID=1506 RepID=UPI003D6C7416